MTLPEIQTSEIDEGDGRKTGISSPRPCARARCPRLLQAGETFLANHDIAERCKLPRSTVSRLTYTLTKLGYLISWRMWASTAGTQLVALSTVALGGLDVRQLARSAMRDLANFSGATVGLAVRDRLSMRYVECLRGPAAISLNIDVGVRMSMVRSSIGRAYIAALTEAERAPLFENCACSIRSPGPRCAPILKRPSRIRPPSAAAAPSGVAGECERHCGRVPAGRGHTAHGHKLRRAHRHHQPRIPDGAVRPRLIEMVRRLDGVMGA